MTTVKIEGLRDLEKQLEKLKTGTAKGALRRSLKKAAQPVADAASAMAPRKSGTLAESVTVTSKLSRSQAGKHRRMFRNDRASVEMFIGPGNSPQAITQEFGTYFHPPQPFMRPAWDAESMATLKRLEDNLWTEITKAVQRAEKKAKRG